MEELLTISEAARLMGVCENTLRDWDIEKKFPAVRTAGGHRRYSLTAIRKYLNDHPVETERGTETKKMDVLAKQWEDEGYFEDCGELTKSDKSAFAVVLENTRLMQETVVEDPLFSTNQALYIVRRAWMRNRLRRMVSIQPLLGPCGMCYYLDHSNPQVTKLEAKAVAAVTRKCDFTVFRDAEFDHVKDLYANALARELEIDIFTTLYKYGVGCDLDTVLQQPGLLKGQYNYIVGPPSLNDLRGREEVNGVDIVTMPTILSDDFSPMVIMGRYPIGIMELPVFMPYILWTVSPELTTGVAHVFTRSGWLTNG